MKFIGIDIGTTTITGLVYDLERRTILHAVTEDNPYMGFKGHEDWERLQDPDKIFLQVEGILNNLIAWEPEVLGIGLTGQMHGIVYVDQDGKQVSPLYTWQDSRGGLLINNSSSYAEYLSEHSGYTVASGYGLATHFYNLRNALVPANAVSFCTIADYVALRLTGSTKQNYYIHRKDAANLCEQDSCAVRESGNLLYIPPAIINLTLKR